MYMFRLMPADAIVYLGVTNFDDLGQKDWTKHIQKTI